MDPASPYPLAVYGSRTKGFEQLPFNSLSQSGATDVAPIRYGTIYFSCHQQAMTSDDNFIPLVVSK
jgi:hypothetical protein